MFKFVFDTIAKISAKRKTLRELENRSNRELADIGISRYDIRAVVDNMYN